VGARRIDGQDTGFAVANQENRPPFDNLVVAVFTGNTERDGKRVMLRKAGQGAGRQPVFFLLAEQGRQDSAAQYDSERSRDCRVDLGNDARKKATTPCMVRG
jgi:hypothetical protein